MERDPPWIKLSETPTQPGVKKRPRRLRTEPSEKKMWGVSDPPRSTDIPQRGVFPGFWSTLKFMILSHKKPAKKVN